MDTGYWMLDGNPAFAGILDADYRSLNAGTIKHTLKLIGWEVENLNDILTIVLVFSGIALVIGIFVKISLRIWRGGGGLTTVVLGATDEFYHKDKKKAVEMIVDQNAGKKMEDQASSDPDKENNKE